MVGKHMPQGLEQVTVVEIGTICPVLLLNYLHTGEAVKPQVRNVLFPPIQ